MREYKRVEKRESDENVNIGQLMRVNTIITNIPVNQR